MDNNTKHNQTFCETQLAYKYVLYEFSRLTFGLFFILMGLLFICQLAAFIASSKNLSLMICSLIVTIVFYGLYKHFAIMEEKTRKILRSKNTNTNIN